MAALLLVNHLRIPNAINARIKRIRKQEAESNRMVEMQAAVAADLETKEALEEELIQILSAIGLLRAAAAGILGVDLAALAQIALEQEQEALRLFPDAMVALQ